MFEIELGGGWPSTYNAECALAIGSKEGFSLTIDLGAGFFN
jgi:hypothetical protein